MDWATVLIMFLAFLTGTIVSTATESIIAGIISGIIFCAVVGFSYEIITDAKREKKIREYEEWKYNVNMEHLRIEREMKHETQRSITQSGISIHRGFSITGPVVYYIDGNYVHAGISSVAPIVYYIDGNEIHEGSSNVGPVVYYVEGNYVHAGISSVAPIVYYIDGNEVHEGSSNVGSVVFYLEL